MPEAEDVVLEVVERAAHAVRGLWERGAAEPSGALRFEPERRRLDLWLQACFGTTWPLVAADDPIASGWLARAFGTRSRASHQRVACATSDGRTIIVPRDLASESDGLHANDLRLLMALGLGARLERASVACCPLDPIARDVFWSVEGGLADTHLRHVLPGLARQLDVARAVALRRRHAGSRLQPVERAVEALVRRLLERSASDALRDVVAEKASVAEILAFAERFARHFHPRDRARYRGIAPVAHWGMPRPDLCRARCGETPATASTGTLQPDRTRDLTRRVEARRPEPGELEGRPGPFVLPFGDPQLSVQDPAGVVRPTDQGDESDLDALAEELSRLECAPRIETDAPVRDIMATEEEAQSARAPGATQRDVDGIGCSYPEWDVRLNAYRMDHCRVREGRARRGDARSAARMLAARAPVIRELRRRFEMLRPRRLRRPREPEGDSVDIDTWCGEWAALCAGRSPDGRIYTRERRERRDVAVTLLVDTSASSDTWISGRERVIDVEKDALLCFCEALSALGDRYSVLAFSGQGPTAVRVLRIKDAGERLNEDIRLRIAGIEPRRLHASRSGASPRDRAPCEREGTATRPPGVVGRKALRRGRVRGRLRDRGRAARGARSDAFRCSRVLRERRSKRPAAPGAHLRSPWLHDRLESGAATAPAA